MSKKQAQITFDFGAEFELPVVETKTDVKVLRGGGLQKPEKIKIAVEETKAEKTTARKKKEGSKRGRPSTKEIAAKADLIQLPTDEELFSKQYYSIGKVAKMFRENQSLIRFWETEFDILKPKKNSKGDRYFRPQDVKNLELIYDLLRRRKFTIEGAKEFLRQNKSADEKFALIQSLEKLKGFLLELKAGL